jgi:hypothetical protein
VRFQKSDKKKQHENRTGPTWFDGGPVRSIRDGRRIESRTCRCWTISRLFLAAHSVEFSLQLFDLSLQIL